MEDERFKHITTDPKFRRIPKAAQKIKIDNRFKSMFKDKKFKITYTVDKRGRPVNHTSNEDLKRYYELSSEEDSSEDDQEKNLSTTDKFDNLNKSTLLESEEENEKSGEHFKNKNKKIRKGKLKISVKESQTITDKVKNKLKNLNIDYARGEVPLISESSSDDEETEDELSENEQIEHKWGELDADADQTEEATYRLAACNMDWDRIRAVDFMVLFSSFLPTEGAIKSVAIYPSEFGKQRMKEEDTKGPIELVETATNGNQEENEEGSEYHMEKLRQYQLNRLKYYYAVIVFDSPETANKIYTECDGMEYESSAIKLDLRFIPDDMTFDDIPKDTCDKVPEINKYQPRFFTTTALQQVKVDLTWDETNPNRIELTQKLNSGKIDEISEADMQNYLASSSEDETESILDDEPDSDAENSDNKNVIDKYKSLLQSIEKKEQEKNKSDVELEISWGIDLKEKTDKLSKQNNSKDATPFQKYLDKRKEKRKERKKKKSTETSEDNTDIPSDIDLSDPYFAEEFNKPEFKKQASKNFKESSTNETDNEKNAELELLLLNEDDSKEHFSLKKIQENEETSKKKKKKGKEISEDNFKIDVKDERFSALYTSHHYNIDPTDPHYKKTKGMELLINEKLKRRIEDTTQDSTKKMKPNDLESKGTFKSKRNELNMLVKSIKTKTKEFKNK